MPKFSIVVPVYGVEKYIKNCLDSIMNQTYKDFEVIVVDDGTKDKSMEIVKDYPVKVIHQENQGLSAARNTGVKKATGEYLLFVDSDDTIEKDLLRELTKSLRNNPDLVRFQIKEVYEGKKDVKNYPEKPFHNLTGVAAFERITHYHFVENAWAYLYKTSFFKENKFEFKKGTLHEDFGLIPLVIMKANTVNSIDYIGYNYLQREGSIMSAKDYEKTKKKVQDFYNHYHFLIEEIDKTNLNSKVMKSFIANSLILKICELKGKDYKEYKKKLKQEGVYQQILDNSIPRKFKKILFHISPKFTAKVRK